jgi:hypothetical protein
MAVAASANRNSLFAVSPPTIPAADARATAPAKMKLQVVFIAASVYREFAANHRGKNGTHGTVVFVRRKQ